ncbi:hypothetical protein OG413_15650 [Streptomyces sp. NBC_01433]|uniref:hypothetical protein n=1 Tax=Streptomyces sp. NBC_01433 TaxID=2903864 RepID=UPI00224FEEB5|nr:hypothetical protein [Streptomyces sp. NBC_01433]MCX4676719.1 hypothetical protein [Streptomyces sp. NBC_01433]
MNTTPDDGEHRVKEWLRRKIDGPPVEEQPPLIEVHVIPTPDPADDEDEPEDDAYDEPEPKRPWWYVLPGPFGRPAPEAAAPQSTVATAPGIHVTVHQPPPPGPPPWLAADPAAERAAEKRHRRRIWVAYHAGAAGVGWYTGLAGLMRDLLDDVGPAAPAVGIAMGLVTHIVASYLPGLPYMPPALRPVVIWAARIPVCTAALALALHAPGAL